MRLFCFFVFLSDVFSYLIVMAKRAKLLWITIYSKQPEIFGFTAYAVLISNLFTYNQTPVILPKTSRFNLELNAEPEDLWIIPENMGESIYTVRATFPFNEFYNRTDPEKKKLLAGETYNCLVPLYKKLGLDIDELYLNYQKILANDFKMTRIIAGGEKWNKSRTFKAKITVEYFLGYCMVSVNFHSKTDELLNKTDLFKAYPGPLSFSWIIKTIMWSDNNTIRLINATGEFLIDVTVDGLVTVAYAPKRRDEEGVKEQIRFLTLERMIEI
jgi:hypothetical protein